MRLVYNIYTLIWHYSKCLLPRCLSPPINCARSSLGYFLLCNSFTISWVNTDTKIYMLGLLLVNVKTSINVIPLRTGLQIICLFRLSKLFRVPVPCRPRQCLVASSQQSTSKIKYEMEKREKENTLLFVSLFFFFCISNIFNENQRKIEIIMDQ